MKKIIIFLFAIVSTQFIIAQTITDGLNSIYKEGYPSVVTFDDVSILNVKLSPDNEIWATINFADGTQRACPIKNDKSKFSIPRVKGEDNTLIAGFNTKGKVLLSVGFPDGRKIYEGDKALIRSTYSQRDIIEIEPEDYLVTIERNGTYQIYRYKKGITKYPELVFKDFENSDLINLSYYNNVLLFDSYSDGVYTPYYSEYSDKVWSMPVLFHVNFLESCRSTSFSDSIIVAIKGNQLMIWEIIPDSYWEWEVLTTEEQVVVSHIDTTTTQIKFFYWHSDDVKGNFMEESLFDSLGLSMNEEFVLNQNEDEVLFRMGDVFDDVINSMGYIFSSSDFDINTATNIDTNTSFVDNIMFMNITEETIFSVSLAEFILMVDNAKTIILQVGAYSEKTYDKHQKEGGFVVIIGGSYPINCLYEDNLYKYQIDLTSLFYKEVLKILQEYEGRLIKNNKFVINDIPFLIITGKDGISYKYKTEIKK